MIIYLKKTNFNSEKINWLLLHQANQRILDSVGERLKCFHQKKILSNLSNYGNTLAATIPLMLDEAIRNKKIKKMILLPQVVWCWVKLGCSPYSMGLNKSFIMTVAWVFPGQGSQKIGMANKIIDLPNAKYRFNHASEVFERNLFEICESNSDKKNLADDLNNNKEHSNLSFSGGISLIRLL